MSPEEVSIRQYVDTIRDALQQEIDRRFIDIQAEIDRRISAVNREAETYEKTTKEAVTAASRSLADKLAEMQRTINALELWKANFLGRATVFGLVWTILIAGVAAIMTHLASGG